jgi:hypothetical protein
VAEAYEGLKDGYVQFPTDASPEELVDFEASLLSILAQTLKEKGLNLRCKLRVAVE